MKRPYQVSSVLILLFSALVARESLELKYYTPLGPGPGFFPLWLSAFLGVLAAAMFYQATFRDTQLVLPDFFETKDGYVRIAAIVAAVACVVVLMESLGFRLVMLAFYTFLLSALGRQHPALTVGIALVGSFGLYHVFVAWLGVPLPIGVFGI